MQNISEVQTQIIGIDYGEYFWRVRPVLENGEVGCWSETWSFTTIPAAPTAPSLISPPDGSVSIPLTTTFSWANVQGADSYHIQISEDEVFTNSVADESGLLVTTFDFSLPGYQKTYYWRVRASNSTGDSDWSETWSFTTIMMTGMEELHTGYELKVYPNPTNNFIVLELHTHLNYNAELMIYYSMGNRLIMSSDINVLSGKNLINVDMQNLPSGTYHYRIVGNELEIVGRYILIK